MTTTRILELALSPLFALALLPIAACNLPNDPNLNNPSVNDFSTITNLPAVQVLVTGALRGDRVQNENEIIYGETIGRDGMRLTGSEPRFVTELLAPGTIDKSDFLGGALWSYPTVRLINIGMGGVQGAPSGVLNAQDKPATLGYLQTLKALELLRAVETRDTAGVPVDVNIQPTDPPAPLRCKNDALSGIALLLDSAAANLAQGGASFPFVLPPTFSGFDTPAGFLTFNRALAAKTDVYLAFRNYAKAGTIDAAELDSAQAALTASFMVADSTMLNSGPAHAYSTGTGDATSGLWDQGLAKTAFRVNPQALAEADAGDRRVALGGGGPIDSSSAAAIIQGADTFSSNLIFTRYPSPTTPTPIITNKELLLLQAEVNWGKGNYATALAEADFIRRNDGGLASDTTTAAAAGVLNRILYEKRYSLLWQSGAHWIDARLFGKDNGSAPPAGLGTVFGKPPQWNFPIPANEQLARSNNLTKQTCTLP